MGGRGRGILGKNKGEIIQLGLIPEQQLSVSTNSYPVLHKLAVAVAKAGPCSSSSTTKSIQTSVTGETPVDMLKRMKTLHVTYAQEYDRSTF